VRSPLARSIAGRCGRERDGDHLAALGGDDQRAAAGLLLALATLTALTGARTAVVWFKICPVVLGGGAGLLLAASWL
jgi:hypothetical protein